MTSWTEQTKTSTSFTEQAKNSTSFTNQDISLTFTGFILREEAFQILREQGDGILRESGGSSATPWSNQTKN